MPMLPKTSSAQRVNSPAVRFKMFSDLWIQIKFYDYYKVMAGYAFKYDDYVKEGAAIINGESIQHCKIESSNFKYLPNSFSEKYSEFAVKVGDIVIGLNRPITNGLLKIAKIPKAFDGSLLYQRAGKIVYKTDVSADFSFILLDKEISKHTLLEAVGSDQPFISTTKLEKWVMLIPSEKPQQTQIGSYFQHLDKLISLHQAKVNKLTHLKKAMLEKMFPKDGADVPEIRFKGFEGAWEVKCWKETVDISTNMVDPRCGKYDELFHIGPGNIESFTGRIYDNVLKVKDSNLISGKFYFKKGDVIYGKINPQLAKYTITPFDGLASADAYVLKTKNGIVLNFLYTILQTSHFYKYSVSVSSRTGMPKINREELGVYSYFSPNVDEQTQIGCYFRNLDSLIDLHRQELDKLNNLKKACLEKMFV